MEPENPQQAHFIHIVAKLDFVAAIDDPIPTLNETIQRGMLGKVPVLRGSFKVLASQGMKFALDTSVIEHYYLFRSHGL